MLVTQVRAGTRSRCHLLMTSLQRSGETHASSWQSATVWRRYIVSSFRRSRSGAQGHSTDQSLSPKPTASPVSSASNATPPRRYPVDTARSTAQATTDTKRSARSLLPELECPHVPSEMTTLASAPSSVVRRENTVPPFGLDQQTYDRALIELHLALADRALAKQRMEAAIMAYSEATSRYGDLQELHSLIRAAPPESLDECARNLQHMDQAAWHRCTSGSLFPWSFTYSPVKFSSLARNSTMVLLNGAGLWPMQPWRLSLSRHHPTRGVSLTFIRPTIYANHDMTLLHTSYALQPALSAHHNMYLSARSFLSIVQQSIITSLVVLFCTICYAYITFQALFMDICM
jgi:hypothetical protein